MEFTEENVTDNRLIKTIHSEKPENNSEKPEQRLRDLWDKYKQKLSIYAIRIPEREEECGEKIIANMSQICQNKKQHIQATK